MRRPSNAWEALVARYAEGRPICNCGDAYEIPEGGTCCDRNGQRAGCSANQSFVREQIGALVWADLNGGVPWEKA